MTGNPAPTVVIGIGNPMRSDDGVGPAAIARLEETPEVDLVILDGEATRLVEAWRGRTRAIVVDAVRRDAPAGTIHRIDLGSGDAPGTTRPTSSHGAGLAEAMALAQVLDALPASLVVFGVEPADLSHGDGLSDPDAGALDQLVADVRRELAEAGPSARRP